MNSEYYNLFEDLMAASHANSFECAEDITRSLKKHLSLIACTFYSYYEDTGCLSLRSQSGFKYSEYSSFELEVDSLAGRSITRSKVVDSNVLTIDNGYRDQKLVNKYELKRIIAIPLESKKCLESHGTKLCQPYLGVVCLYPDRELDNNLLDKLSLLIGRVYAYSVIQDRVSIRKDIINNSIRAKDLNSFLHKTLQLLSGKWGVEAASVFIQDPRNNMLFMRATTGVKSDLKLIERIYLTTEIEHKTVECFNEEKIITISNKLKVPHKYPEYINDGVKSIMYIPIYEPSGTGVNDESQLVGVLRCINRVVDRDDVREICHHGWEDASLLIFVSEIIGVISHLFRRSDEISLNFERAMHGINKPINTAKVRIKSTQQYLNSQGMLNFPFDNFMKDSISYLEALEWQVQKHAVRDNYKKIASCRINLFGQVLSKILSFMEDIHKTYNVKKFTRNRFEYSNMPSVYGNEKALQVVFRNIVENAMKYAGDKKECLMNLSWEIDGDYLHFNIDDYGIGISKKDATKIWVYAD